jgi:hypothetical protein
MVEPCVRGSLSSAVWLAHDRPPRLKLWTGSWRQSSCIPYLNMLLPRSRRKDMSATWHGQGSREFPSTTLAPTLALPPTGWHPCMPALVRKRAGCGCVAENHGSLHVAGIKGVRRRQGTAGMGTRAGTACDKCSRHRTHHPMHPKPNFGP